jgi:hypothetical protein
MQRILQTIDLWAQKYVEVSTRKVPMLYNLCMRSILMPALLLQLLSRWSSMGDENSSRLDQGMLRDISFWTHRAIKSHQRSQVCQ